MDLLELRRDIDRIDSELVTLFCRRMEISALIADYKKEQNLPIHHPEREQNILQKVADLSGPTLDTYAVSLYRKILELSKDYQIRRNNCG